MTSRMYLMETRMMYDPEFDRLLADAVAVPFSGWDFSWIEGRRVEEEDTETTWDYEERARKLVQAADSIRVKGDSYDHSHASICGGSRYRTDHRVETRLHNSSEPL